MSKKIIRHGHRKWGKVICKTSVFWSTFSPQNKGFGGIMEESFLITNGPVRSFYNELIENLNSCAAPQQKKIIHQDFSQEARKTETASIFLPNQNN